MDHTVVILSLKRVYPYWRRSSVPGTKMDRNRKFNVGGYKIIHNVFETKNAISCAASIMFWEPKEQNSNGISFF